MTSGCWRPVQPEKIPSEASARLLFSSWLWWFFLFLFRRDRVTFGDDTGSNVWKKCVDRRAFSISNRWPPNEQPHSQQMRAEQNSVKSRAWSQQDHQISQQATALLFHSSGVLYPKEKRWGEVRWGVATGERRRWPKATCPLGSNRCGHSFPWQQRGVMGHVTLKSALILTLLNLWKQRNSSGQFCPT